MLGQNIKTATVKALRPSSSVSTTYHFPGEGLVPEGRALLQAEEGAADRSAEGRGDSSRSSSRHKVSLVPERSDMSCSGHGGRGRREPIKTCGRPYLSLRK